MREEFIELLKKLDIVSYKVSEELPFSNSNIPMYIKNVKYIYVDNEISTIETLIPIMSGVNVEVDIQTIRIYLSNDAKKLPPDYNTLVSLIKNTKEDITGNYYKRDCVIENNYENDISITTFEFKFYKLKD
jgi:hypothetical protein